MDEQTLKDMLQAHAARVATVVEAQTATLKTVADCVLENTQLMRIVAEELRADRQIDHHRLMDAVKALEDSSKKIDAIAKKVEAAARNSYDAYTTAEALRGQLEQPLRVAAEAATKGAEAAARGAEAATKGAEAAARGAEGVEGVKKRVDDMTGEFKTLALAEKDKLTKSQQIWTNTKEMAAIFNKFEPLTRVLITLLVFALVAAGWLYHVWNAG